MYLEAVDKLILQQRCSFSPGADFRNIER